ncbi:MAG: Type 1 glutamine amidotransferase-like domain-containing protein [Clostridiales bacterium]|nr:Type 1 glutamine amidotransferase-like domain-containing protein [Clostridiales bacterium]
MVLFLTSLLRTHYYDESGARVPVALGNENEILANIKKRLKRINRLVVVANDQYDSADNAEKLSAVRESLRLSGMEFKEAVMLDVRNKSAAKEIISGADLIILTGGKCVCQAEFFREIGLKDILTGYNGIVIGVSAGTMNLCKTVANFPEEKSDLNDERWFDGMGFVSETIVPHYDGKTNNYQFACEDFDVAKYYILPMSKERELVGLPNDSYIIIDHNGHKQYRGDVYIIADGKSKRLN